MKTNKLLVATSMFVIMIFSLFSEVSASTETRRCALESCHGLNLKCGFNPPDMCTQVYTLGDFCRQYASCELKSETCSLVKSPTLNKCIDCVKACLKTNPVAQSECEAKCRSKIEKLGK